VSRNLWNEHKEVRVRLLRKSNLCGICGKPITKMKDATIDHVIPLSRGGVDSPLNMQLAHDKCNQEKGNKLP
jgi:5-methylcytosine-specific restriction endonuclease McrA